MNNWGLTLELGSMLATVTTYLWIMCALAGCVAVVAVASFVVEVASALRHRPEPLSCSEFMGFGQSAPAAEPAIIWESNESESNSLHHPLDDIGGDTAVARA